MNLWLIGKVIILLYCKDKTALFHLQYPQPMIWNPETLKCSCCWHSTFFISSLLDFLFSVLLSSHSNSENYSCSFLKFHEYMINMMRISFLPTNWWRCHGRPSFFNHSRNLYAGLWTHCNNYSTAPSKSLGKICWWCLFYP